MASIEEHISKDCREAIHKAISEAEGREVFFLGHCDKNKVVQRVTIAARGNERAVPAILRVSLQEGDVVIHNHPFGSMSPSDADLSIASQLGGAGVGFYIVDNQLSQVYVVVEAFEKKELVPIDGKSTLELLKSKGKVSQALKAYEPRPQQIEMMEAVIEAFNQEEIALLEAGPGTGKTLAYLIPAVLWATANKERVAISTNTINLQEQIVQKDLPLLQKALPMPFSSALLKGRGNYVCLRKVDLLEKEGMLFFADEEEEETLRLLLPWARQTDEGSLSDLNFVPRPEVWEKVASESDYCQRARCPHFQDCFVNKARRRASSAQILVVNHHLILADIALRKEMESYHELALLPPYRRIVFDEAHHLEEAATNFFTSRVTRAGLLQLLGRFFRFKKGEKGLFPFIAMKLLPMKGDKIAAQCLKAMEERLIPQKEALVSLLTQTFDNLQEIMEQEMLQETELQMRLTQRLKEGESWQKVRHIWFASFLDRLSQFISELALFKGNLERLQEAQKGPLERAVGEIEVLSSRLKKVRDTLEEILDGDDPQRVRWVELKPSLRPKGAKALRLCSAPLTMDEVLAESLIMPFPTIIFTSATLTTQGHFGYIKASLGIKAQESDGVLERCLPSPFDFKSRALVGIVTDLPLPLAPEFEEELAPKLIEALAITQGRALLLFTSYKMLDNLYSRLKEPLELMDLPPLQQGSDSRHRLLERFKREKASVLFATESFWEGVDVEGDALECVIMPKLPFKVPTDPVFMARQEAMEREGRNPFLEMTLPQAIIKFKQGFGRLIRRKDDRGCFLLFDRRVVEKSYGQAFIASLPPCQLIIGSHREVFDRMLEFLQ